DSLFFFSSRRRHTRFSRDWSSDVCSSDLLSGMRFRDVTWREIEAYKIYLTKGFYRDGQKPLAPASVAAFIAPLKSFYKWGSDSRSEERRVGKECRCRWAR